MKHIRLISALLCAVFLLAAFCSCGAKIPTFNDFEDNYTDALPEKAEDGLTLHAFNWTYREIIDNLDGIKNAGFKNILTMPVQQPKGGGGSWWYVCSECHGMISEHDLYCKHCGAKRTEGR